MCFEVLPLDSQDGGCQISIKLRKRGSHSFILECFKMRVDPDKSRSVFI